MPRYPKYNTEEIIELSKKEEYIHQYGQFYGKINITKIAKKINCDRSTVRYHLYENIREQKKKAINERIEYKKTPEYAYEKYNHLSEDPESIFNEESFRIILE